MTADLGAALAAEEHTQGRPYTADPDHCDRCAEVDRAWAWATCEHEDYVDVRSLNGNTVDRLCGQCGTMWTVEP